MNESYHLQHDYTNLYYILHYKLVWLVMMNKHAFLSTHNIPVRRGPSFGAEGNEQAPAVVQAS